MQYFNNKAESNQQTLEEVHTHTMNNNNDDDQTTLLEYINFHNINLISTHRAHTEYWAMLAHVSEDLCIPDGGADSHVGCRTWLPLCGLTGPKIKYTNVTGFDENSAKRSGLPIISAVTKTINQKGENIFLRTKHLIYNHTSNHTLLSTYQMRELGHIVDDVSKRHLKNEQQRDTHKIKFVPGIQEIDLETKAAFPTFKISKPSVKEYESATDEKIIDIAFENWNHQEHHEESLKGKPEVLNTFLPDININILTSNNFNETLDKYFHETYVFYECEHFQNENPTEAWINEVLNQVPNNEEGSLLPEEPYYFDAEDIRLESPGKVMHLSIDYQLTRKGIKRPQPLHLSTTTVNTFLTEIDYDTLTAKNQSFNTFAYVVSAVERIHQLEALQPKFTWKSLDILKMTIENTTQWGRVISQYPMKKHHVSRFPWNNRKRLIEEVATDTIFLPKPSFTGETCAQIYYGLMSTMINIYQMFSKSTSNILPTYQDFLRYEGVPEALHRDLDPEEKDHKIIELNHRMMVKDTYGEAGHPNQNPIEALGIQPLKTRAEVIMNRTGADDGSLPWIYKYFADIHNISASPRLGWKTPISVRHGYTTGISAFLQYQFWEQIYFKVDENTPSSKEAPGHWMGVSETVGDLMTYDIWNHRTRKVIQCSAIRPADPKKGGIPNLRQVFDQDNLDHIDSEIVEPSNVLDTPGLMNTPTLTFRHRPKSTTTNKHKVKWHDTQEATEQEVDEFSDFEECQPYEDQDNLPKSQDSDFIPPTFDDDLKQSAPERRKNLTRTCKKNHLTTAAACLALASCSMLRSGEPLTPPLPSKLLVNDPFNPESSFHILDTTTDYSEITPLLNQEVFARKVQLQHINVLEDESSDDHCFVPAEILDHRLAFNTRRQIKVKTPTSPPDIKIVKDKHLRLRTHWQDGIISWVEGDALKEQNPWVVANYAIQRELLNHPDFHWVNHFIKNKYVAAHVDEVKAMVAKTHQGPKFKFGVQVPVNSTHTLKLDNMHNSTLWRQSIDAELDSINTFKTFRVLDEGEGLPEGYLKIPYHLVFDVKFDGRRKCRLVAGGNHKPRSGTWRGIFRGGINGHHKN